MKEGEHGEEACRCHTINRIFYELSGMDGRVDIESPLPIPAFFDQMATMIVVRR